MEEKNLLHLVGFRAIAVYFILVAHSIQAAFSYGTNSPYLYVTYLTNLGISIFFVLSGFVITYTYYDRFIQQSWWQATRNFAVARFARLYPLYIICLMGDIHHRHSFIHYAKPSTWFSYVTLTQSWLCKELFAFTDTWPISTECFFYMCFALWMLPSANPPSKPSIQRAAIATLTGFMLILAFLFAARPEVTSFLHWALRGRADFWTWWFEYVSPYMRIGEFMAGVCAARMFMVTRHEEYVPANHRRATALCIGSVTAIIALSLYNAICAAKAGSTLWVTPDNFILFLSINFGYAPFLAYIFYASSRYPSMFTKWCSMRWMVAGGRISYSLYLLQFEIIAHIFPIPIAASSTITPLEGNVLKIALSLLLTTIAAYCSYHVVEMPCRHYLRKWFLRERDFTRLGKNASQADQEEKLLEGGL